MIQLQNTMSAQVVKFRLESVIPEYRLWDADEIIELNKSLRSFKDNSFDDYKESVRDEDG